MICYTRARGIASRPKAPHGAGVRRCTPGPAAGDATTWRGTTGALVRLPSPMSCGPRRCRHQSSAFDTAKSCAKKKTACFGRGSIPGPSACQANVITNYTTETDTKSREAALGDGGVASAKVAGGSFYKSLAFRFPPVAQTRDQKRLQHPYNRFKYILFNEFGHLRNR